MEDLDLRVLGRARGAAEAEFSRELTSVDLAVLSLPRHTPKPSGPKKLRDSHHAMARLIADGISNNEISAITGHASSWISTMKNDPAFQDLVAFYQQTANVAYASSYERMCAVKMDTLNVIHERLLDSPDAIPLGELHDQFKMLADRTGDGPQSKSTNLHIHTGFAERLEQARQRAADRALEAPYTGGGEAEPEEAAE